MVNSLQRARLPGAVNTRQSLYLRRFVPIDRLEETDSIARMRAIVRKLELLQVGMLILLLAVLLAAFSYIVGMWSGPGSSLVFPGLR